METPCPACGKSNDLAATEVCSRCSCDLGPLARIITGAIWHLKAAAHELRSGDWDEALKQAERSWMLRHSPRAARAACLAAMALGRRKDALCWRRRAGGADG